jgi:subfamily B ATP-binding cassette protein HlyB/CyaB
MPTTLEPTAQAVSRLRSGLVCLIALARHHRIAASAEQLTHQHCLSPAGFGHDQLLLIARSLGLDARLVQSRPARLPHIALPAIGETIQGDYFLLDDLEQPLLAAWNGTLLLARPKDSLPADTQRQGLRWFLPVVMKYRRLLGQVLLICCLLQLFALVTPLFFQAVMDKVLVHRGLSTLDVLAIGMAAIVLFESALGGLRHLVFAHTASRIDVELGARVFRHLLALPADYFQARRVGESVARLRELDSVRGFLTGSSLGALLDVLFAALFIGVMFAYSAELTFVVLLSLPLYVGITLWITPLLRARLEQGAQRSADNQAFLAESLNAVATVKSMAVQGPLIARWNRHLAASIGINFKARVLSVIAVEAVGLVGKAVTVVTLWLGARLVMNGQLSVGQLIAFNLFAGRVSQPVLRLAQLWTQFQQASVSVRRLGDIVDSPTEQQGIAGSVLPALAGRVEFDQVSFSFRPDSPLVLRNLSLTIEAGEVIALVGHSGSGKSTLGKLLQRLHRPQSGRVLVDGMDLALADVAALRQQIGVVLQDSLLFQRSVRDNIAFARPEASLQAIVEVARLAGADAFINDLAHGYDTLLSERGASLSGGQRQRIALARALLADPRILILDEATSALDHESEALISRNMPSICQGRTVIIIAHRLSAVQSADRVAVLHRGQLVEVGSPASLLDNPDGWFSRVVRAQREGCQ